MVDKISEGLNFEPGPSPGHDHIDPTHVFPFPLDDFQLEAIRYLQEGKSVVVCAPTGSGKTVIAEYAVEMALRENKRCFYTTPLKALSNQKLFDFRQKYGDDKVGLLTGDISVNRDAPLVVMTTEVFRNMLYGTILGDVGQNLKDVAYVVLDECHYMNDAERGTVWEESIIYAPIDIQLVALSATVANADQLTTWIDETHGESKLIVSTFRPVPLRFHFFGDRRIHPLLEPGGGVNKLLKGRFGKRRQTDGPRKRQNPTHPGDVLAVLSARNMLPAIYFLFSRRGCEEAMRKARGIPLLTQAEARELRQAVDEYTKDNANLRTHPHTPYLMEGMAVHHAGMLPSWKGMVEKLFQAGLLKAVFATETLAAGINMPARSTVISSLSKRADEGHRTLTASEFLQMSGRAGRRGMDEVGHVVVVHNTYEPVEDAAKLATSPPDPLSSRFTPSYAMALNLLERHTMAECRDLIERSFGQFVVNQDLEQLYLNKMRWENELESLKDPLCPDEIGDLELYSKRLGTIRAKHKQLKLMERGLKRSSPKGKHQTKEARDAELAMDAEAAKALKDVRDDISSSLAQAYAMPCHGCPVQKPCSRKTSQSAHLTRKLKETNRTIDRESGRYWRTFVSITDILRLKGYLDGATPTKLGRLAAAIRGTNELFLTEVAVSGLLEKLDAPELASVLTCLVMEEGRLNEIPRV
ncbi:MAG: DEAD/DEAH box helicase, partial [Cyanobacteria bacterium]|nr:DEAD/DEAH box helicase [Cyanobacteriota bacterium]